jgi:DNA-PKcs, CC5
LQSVEREQKQRRENEVTMYRRYRIGDLPDIQIPYSALVAPLQGLAHVNKICYFFRLFHFAFFVCCITDTFSFSTMGKQLVCMLDG